MFENVHYLYIVKRKSVKLGHVLYSAFDAIAAYPRTSWTPCRINAEKNMLINRH